MHISRKVRTTEALLLGIMVFLGGCSSPSKPRLPANVQAEALSHFSMGLLAEGGGDSMVALEQFESAIRLDPDEAVLYPPAIALALRLKDSETAVRLAEQVAICRNNDVESSLLKAKVYILTGQPVPAEKQLRQLLTDHPDNPEGSLFLIRLYFSQNRLNDALNCAQNARKNLTDDLPLARQLFELLIQSGRFDEALTIYPTLAADTQTDPNAWFGVLVERAQQKNSKALTALLEEQIRTQSPAPALYFEQLGSLYLDAEKIRQAEDLLLNALTVYPKNERLYIFLGVIQLKQNRYDDAYTTLNHIRINTSESDESKSPFFRFNFILAAQSSGHIEQAAESLTETCTENPSVINQYVLTALSGTAPVSVENAIDLLNRCRTLRPTAIEPVYYLMMLHAEQKNYGQALENARLVELLAKQNAQTDRLDGQFYYQMAALYERTGQRNTAENLFYKTAEIGDERIAAAAKNYIAYMWAERGEKLDQGLALIQSALTTDPENGAFIDTLGWIYYMQGRYTEALTELEKANAIVPGDPAVLKHLGDTWLKLGNQDAAVEYWKKAQQLDPGAINLLEKINAQDFTTKNIPSATDNP